MGTRAGHRPPVHGRRWSVAVAPGAILRRLPFYLLAAAVPAVRLSFSG